MRKSILPFVLFTLLAAQSPSCAAGEKKISNYEKSYFVNLLKLYPKEAIELLRKKPALAQTRYSEWKHTPLQWMVTSDWKDDHEALAELLLKHKCPINADLDRDDYHLTALMIAALYNRVKNVKWLLAHGAKQRSSDHPNTALKIANEGAKDYQKGSDEHQQYTKIIAMLKKAKKKQAKKERKGAQKESKKNKQEGQASTMSEDTSLKSKDKQANPRSYWLASPFALVAYVVITVCAAYYLYGKARQGGRKESRQPRMKRRAR